MPLLLISSWIEHDLQSCLGPLFCEGFSMAHPVRNSEYMWLCLINPIQALFNLI
jgi:hypothetical protein